MDEYDGKVNWVYRHFPLSFHNPLATKEAEASECANELGGNDSFWAYTDLIYEQTTSNGRGLQESDLMAMAEKIGLEESEFQECLNSGKYLESIRQDITEGSRAGITGTPGNIIKNNKTGDVTLVSGAQPFENFKRIIDEMIQ